MDYVIAGGMRVARTLYDFVNAEAIPGTGIEPAAFWRDFGALVCDLASRNQALLDRRDAVQCQIDAWHLEQRGKAIDAARYTEQQQVPGAIVLRLEAGLFYFNCDHVKSAILVHLQRRPNTITVVLDLSSSANIDLAGARMLRDLHAQLDHDGISLRLAEVHGFLRDLLHREGLQERIPGVARRTSVAHLLEEQQAALSA